MPETPLLDPNEADVLTMAQAARLLAFDGKIPNPSTLSRWCIKGVNGVRLRYVRRGRRMFTTREDVEQFVTSLTAADQRDTERNRSACTTAARAAQSAEVDAELAGI